MPLHDHAEQRRRTHQLLDSHGVAGALFASPYSVMWLTGYAPTVFMGQSPFTGGPAVVWYADGHFTLIAHDAAADSDDDCTTLNYTAYTADSPLRGAEYMADVLRAAVTQRKPHSTRIGVETFFVTAHQQTLLGESVKGADFVAVDRWLEPLRMIKTAREIEILRRNFAVTDAGHAAARVSITHASREVDLWTEVHATLERVAGQRLLVGNDCVVNTREFNVGGFPQDLPIVPNGSAIVDIGIRLDGYWTDSCGTYFPGRPTAKQKDAHQIALDALEYAISLVKPSVSVNEIDRKARQFIADHGYTPYVHHTGHGIGVAAHEEPRIVPYNETPLAPGMVIMLEPGVYIPGQVAVRWEDGLLVTETGAEVLTHFDKGLPTH